VQSRSCTEGVAGDIRLFFCKTRWLPCSTHVSTSFWSNETRTVSARTSTNSCPLFQNPGTCILNSSLPGWALRSTNNSHVAHRNSLASTTAPFRQCSREGRELRSAPPKPYDPVHWQTFFLDVRGRQIVGHESQPRSYACESLNFISSSVFAKRYSRESSTSFVISWNRAVERGRFARRTLCCVRGNTLK
jgi:hypothetical protein